MMTSAMVLAGYQQRIEQTEAAITQLQMRQGTTLAILVLAIAALLFCTVAFARRTVPGWYPLLPAAMVVAAFRKYRQQSTGISRSVRLRRFYKRGAARLEEEWVGAGTSGEEFAEPDHVYAADLNLFGEGSLFERLCIARTHLGRQRLAEYLQRPAVAGAIRQRQAGVRELSERADLRERITLLGEREFEESRSKTFTEWLDAAPVGIPGWLRPIVLCSSAVLAALSLTVAVIPSIWPSLLPVILPMVALHAAIGLWVRGRVARVLRAAAFIAGEMGLIREGLELLGAERFAVPKLAALAECAAPAGPAIGHLMPWFTAAEQRNKDWFYIPSLWLMVGTQTALAIEAWRRRHGDELRRWLDAWSEFEALNCLACYAYESPEDCWAEVDESRAVFHAEDLGHPLLDRAICVRNDLSLGESSRFYVLSGSNMAGKSTLLRSIGLAAVLTAAGAPVRARALKLGVMRLCASISIVDSLRDGKSRFLAEVERLPERSNSRPPGRCCF
jgi:hypothetical protein